MTKIFIFPGQGSQKLGMGAGLLDKFPELVRQADTQLGYSIEILCLEDPNKQLGLTEYTQPALYIVNALSYLKKTKETGQKPDFVAGHSLGEYNTLFAAEAFDFITGLKLVQKRGQLMGNASGGGMAAIIGLSGEKIKGLLQNSSFNTIDIANLNSPTQTVISGPKKDIEGVAQTFKEAGARFVPLNVSAAFHSRYMKDAQKEFEAFLADFKFSPLKIPVISNYQALPYQNDNIKENLTQQITHPVRWVESIQYLLKQPNPEFEEIGPGNVLTGLIRQIKS